MRHRLDKTMKPVPTIRDPDTEESPEVLHMKAPMSIPRKSPRKRPFQDDQYPTFLEADVIKSFDHIDEKMAPNGFTFAKYDDHLVFYELKTDGLFIPEVTICIRIDDDLHVKLFYRGSPIPLPEWFRKGRECKFSRKSMLQNLVSYVKVEGEQTSEIF